MACRYFSTSRPERSAMTLSLTPGIYGADGFPLQGPFGLRGGQHISHQPHLAHTGWFNGRGQRIGSGDLDKRHLLRIAVECPIGEHFLILNEPAAHWRLIEQSDRYDYDDPGIDYVSTYATYMVITGAVYKITDTTGDPCDPLFKPLPRSEMMAMLGAVYVAA